MTTLYDWAQTALRTVEQDGAAPHKVVLTTMHDNEVWNTWYGPFPDIDDWVTQANAYTRSLENDWPTREVQILFTVLSGDDEVLSRFPWRVKGKNAKSAAAIGDSNAAAMAMAFDNVALTIEKLQRLINTQLDTARKTAEVNSVTMFQQTELIRLMRQNQILAEPEKKEDDLITQLVKDHGGDFVEIAKLAVERWQPAGTPPKGKAN